MLSLLSNAFAFSVLVPYPTYSGATSVRHSSKRRIHCIVERHARSEGALAGFSKSEN
jgi:hypothetical protein